MLSAIVNLTQYNEHNTVDRYTNTIIFGGYKTNLTAEPDGDLATVAQIIDGDTIDVAIGGIIYRVRYIGMDTPERGDYFFSEATEANQALMEGQPLRPLLRKPLQRLSNDFGS